MYVTFFLSKHFEKNVFNIYHYEHPRELINLENNSEEDFYILGLIHTNIKVHLLGKNIKFLINNGFEESISEITENILKIF